MKSVYIQKNWKDFLNHGAIVKTEDGTGEVVSIETLKEKIRVRFKDTDDVFYKKYDAKDVTVIKDAEANDDIKAEDLENVEDLKELEELEKLEKNESKNNDNI